MQLLTASFPERPAIDAALAAALVRRAARGESGPVLRVYCPAPTLAFGRLDAIRPGFADAVAAARAHGFAPVLRAPGGHAAAYHEATLVLEVIAPAADAVAGVRARFSHAAAALAGVLRGLGVDARVGAVPGEYCPGEFSVNAAGRVKLAGIAQRLVAGAWLVGAELVVSDGARIRDVLADVHAALGLELDPATAAAVDELNPDVDVGVDAVRSAVLAAAGDPAEVPPDPALLAEAGELVARHEVS